MNTFQKMMPKGSVSYKKNVQLHYQVQIKTTMKYYYTSIRMAIVKN